MVMHKRKIHLNERTPVPSYKCTECRKVFVDTPSLQLHMTKDHVQVPVPPEVPPNIEQLPIHNIAGPHHLHHPHHQALIQPPLLPPGMGYHHQRLHPYWNDEFATLTFNCVDSSGHNLIKNSIHTSRCWINLLSMRCLLAQTRWR